MKTYCDPKLPSKYVFGLREFSKSHLKCRGWFLSPYENLVLKVELPGGGSMLVESFEAHPEVREKHPEYEQDGRGFFFETRVPENCEYFDFSLCSGERVLAQERFPFKSFYNADKGSGKRGLEELIWEEGKPYVPNGNAQVLYFALDRASFEREYFFVKGVFFSRTPPGLMSFVSGKKKKLKTAFLTVEEKGDFLFRGESLKKYSFEGGLSQWGKTGEKFSVDLFCEKGSKLISYGVHIPFVEKKEKTSGLLRFKKQNFLQALKKELIL